MTAAKKTVGIKSNSFAKIIDSAALSTDEKKEAIAQVLTYDVTRTPVQQQALQEEFAAFKAHLKAECQRTGGVLSQAKGMFGDMGAVINQLKKSADASEDEQVAAMNKATHGFMDAVKKGGNKVKEGLGNGANAEAQDEASQAKAALNLVAEAAAEAAIRNKVIAEEIAASIEKFNAGALKGLTPTVVGKVKKHIFEAKNEDGQAVDPVAVVKEDLGDAGKAVAKSLGKEVGTVAVTKAVQTAAKVFIKTHLP